MKPLFSDKLCGRQPLKILIGPVLNSLSHLILEKNDDIAEILNDFFTQCCFKVKCSVLPGSQNL